MLPFLATGAVLYALLCLAAWLFQDRLVFFPGPPPARDPSSAGLAFEELELLAADGARLHAWWIPAPAARGAALVSHGNAGSIEHRLHIARAFHAMGLGVLLYDYRGYGRSEGRPREAGLYLDAEAAWEAATGPLGVPAERLVLYGESLGGAVAVELARRRPAAALIVESSFRSLPDVGAAAYPFLPVRLLSHNRFDSLAKIGALELPVLVLHGPADEVIPFEHGEALAAAAGARLVRTEGGHNDGGFAAEVEGLRAVAAFVDEALGREASGRGR